MFSVTCLAVRSEQRHARLSRRAADHVGPPVAVAVAGRQEFPAIPRLAADP